jgi:hypothetical protein
MRVCSLCALLGCGPSMAEPGSAGSGESSSGSTGAADVGTSTTSTSTTSASTASVSTTTATDATAGADDGSSSGGPSGGSDSGTTCGRLQCDVWAQDCPDGMKCTASDRCGPSGTWSGTTCVPVVPDAGVPGEPCFVEDTPFSGSDTCILGAMCWNLDPETLMGTCVALCEGSENAPQCSDPEDVHVIANDGVLTLCLPACDPLAPSCDAGEGCYPIEIGWGPFACLREGLPVYGDQTPTLCPPGSTDVDASWITACDDAEVCCAELCDLEAPSCAGLECTPFHENAPGWSREGLCIDP